MALKLNQLESDDFCKLDGGFGLPFLLMSQEGASNNQIIEAGLHQINLSGTVAKGVKCTVKAILKNKALLVLLAEDTENKDYKNLITGLCKKHNVKLQAVEKKELLGRALGLTHFKADGSVRRQMNCGACAITKYGNVETEELNAFRDAFDPAQ